MVFVALLQIYLTVILLRMDNTTAISYVNRMLGVKFQNLNVLATTM